MATSLPKAVLLCLDPGTSNYGYSVLEFTQSRMRLRKVGRILSTVSILTKDLNAQVTEHSQILHELVEVFQVTHIIAERYMSRRMGGVTIECVNIMIGMILEMGNQKGISVRIIPASQWKNESNRASEDLLPLMYELGKPFRVTPHSIDATMIGLYGRSVLMGKRPYQNLKPDAVVSEIRRVGIEDIGVKIKKVKKRRRRRV